MYQTQSETTRQPAEIVNDIRNAEVVLYNARTAIDENNLPAALRLMRVAMDRIIDMTIELKNHTGGAA